MKAYARDIEPSSAQTRGCGCAGMEKCGCQSACCDLTCLVRPRFFCGQVLTDADLTALAEWTRTRLGLSRYRDGWGVACGLEVACGGAAGAHRAGANDSKAAIVYVNPGYAIDCCGNDLVVCEPLSVDLTELCAALGDPCADLRPASRPLESSKPKNKRRGFEQASDAPVVVNLTLRYGEDLAQGQRAMFRSGCSNENPCEYARILERPWVHAEIVSSPGCWQDDEAERWEADFNSRRTETRDRIEERSTPEALLRYLAKHPLHTFCFLEDVLCELTDKTAVDPVLWALLLLDWTLRELQCKCWSCSPQSGVPLARVLLKRSEVRGTPRCRVLLIDASQPHRRPLGKDCRPVRVGEIDLAPYVGQPVAYAIGRLKQLGVQLFIREEQLSLADVASGLLSVEPQTTLAVVPFEDLLECQRVAAFIRPKSERKQR